MDERLGRPLFEELPASMPGVSTRYVWPPSNNDQANISGTFALGAGFGYLIPFTATRRFRVEVIATHINTAQAAKVIRLGVWVLDDDRGLPGALIYQTADLSLAVVGIKGESCLFQLEPGNYFIGGYTDATTALLTGLNNANLRRLGIDQTTFGSAADTHIRFNAGWTAGTALTGYITTTVDYRSVNPPIFGLRAD